MIKCITFDENAKANIPHNIKDRMKADRQQSELNARASIADDLFKEGKVTRVEAFRVEVDALLGENTGDLKFEDNTDFEDGTM
jgi:hypothetical protein